MAGDYPHRDFQEPLGQLGASYVVNVALTSTSQVLAATARRLSLVPLGAAVCVRVGQGAQTAVTTDHYIGIEERVDIRCPPGSTLAVISSDGLSTGTLRVSELT